MTHLFFRICSVLSCFYTRYIYVKSFHFGIYGQIVESSFFDKSNIVSQEIYTRYLRSLNYRVGEGAHNKQNHDGGEGENHNNHQEQHEQESEGVQEGSQQEGPDQDGPQDNGPDQYEDYGPEDERPVDQTYVYYGPQEQPFYEDVDPCDPGDPHVYDKPECEYMKPTKYPTSPPTTFEPTEFPSGSPTFKSRVDFSDAQVSVLMAADGYRDAHFGHTVALHYHAVAVGAYAEGSGGNAYVFQLENEAGNRHGLKWNLVGDVSAPDETDDFFAYAVALNNNTLYVGAYKSDLVANSAGAVYVYNDDGSGIAYRQTDQLTSFTPSSNEFFGFALSSDGDFTLVGAYGNNDKGTDAGIVYVFQLSSTTNLYTNFARLYATDASDYDAFGSAVDFHGNDVVIGAHGDETRGTGSGSAYVFSYNEGSRAWTQEAKLIGSTVAAHDYFGYSVSVHDGLVLVGAYHGDGNVQSSGVVYVFLKTSLKSGNSKLPGWYEVATLYPADGAGSSYFGYSVSVHNGMAMIGAPGDDTLANAAGSAYIFESGLDHWQMSYKLYGKGSQYDSFGCSVGIFGRVAIAGSLLGDGVTTDSGSAFMFTPKDEYSVPKKKQKQSESLETRLHLRFVEFEKDVESASRLELVGAIGFLSVVLILFIYLILWVRSGKSPMRVTVLPLQQIRQVAEMAVERSMNAAAAASNAATAAAAVAKAKRSKSKKSRNSAGFQEIPIDSSHSSASSMDSSLASSAHSAASAKTASSAFSFSFSKVASGPSPVTSRHTTPSRRNVVDNDTDDDSSDVDIREGKMSLSKGDGTIDIKDKKKKKKLKVVELAKL